MKRNMRDYVRVCGIIRTAVAPKQAESFSEDPCKNPGRGCVGFEEFRFRDRGTSYRGEDGAGRSFASSRCAGARRTGHPYDVPRSQLQRRSGSPGRWQTLGTWGPFVAVRGDGVAGLGDVDDRDAKRPGIVSPRPHREAGKTPVRHCQKQRPLPSVNQPIGARRVRLRRNVGRRDGSGPGAAFETRAQNMDRGFSGQRESYGPK